MQPYVSFVSHHPIYLTSSDPSLSNGPMPHPYYIIP